MNGFCGDKRMLASRRINRSMKYWLASLFALCFSSIGSQEMYQDIL